MLSETHFSLTAPPDACGWVLDACCSCCGATGRFAATLAALMEAAEIAGLTGAVLAELQTRDIRRVGALGFRVLQLRAARDCWHVLLGETEQLTTCPSCCIRRAQA